MATTQQKLILQVIREWMKDRGLTMQNLATDLDTSQSSISRALTGDTELSIDRVYEIARILGVSASSIVEEAERRFKPHFFTTDLEEYFCSDFRRYLVFVSLNTPKTIDQLQTESNSSLVGIQALIKRLKIENLLLTLHEGKFQLNDFGRRSRFKNSKAFYELKTKLYSLQTENTVRNLSQSVEYWKTRDDRLVVAHLTGDQAQFVARDIEALANKIGEYDRQNLRASNQLTEVYQVFLAQKKFSDLST